MAESGDSHKFKSSPNGETYVMQNSRGYCYVCDIDLTSYKHCAQHIKGKNHNTKLLQWNSGQNHRGNSDLGNNNCNELPRMDDVQVNEDTSHQHQESGASFIFSQTNVNLPINEPTTGRVLMCRFCQVPVSSQQNAPEHFAGKKHKKLMKQFETGNLSLQEFSDPHQTEVLKVIPVQCNPSNDVVLRSLISNENSTDTVPNLSETCDLSLPIEKQEKWMENLYGNCDKTDLIGNKLSKMSISNQTLATSISDNNLQPSCSTNSLDPSVASISDNNLQEIYLPGKKDVNLESNKEENRPQQKEENSQNSYLYSPARDKQISNLKPTDDVYWFDGNKGYCKACDVHLTSKSLAKQHLNGERHTKKLKALPIILRKNAEIPVSPQNTNIMIREEDVNEIYNFSGTTGFCHACKCILSSTHQAKDHLIGKQHTKNVEILHLTKGGKTFPLYCDVCNMDFTGEVPAHQHFISDKHKLLAELLTYPTEVIPGITNARMITNTMGVNWFICDICRKPLNTIDQLKIHQQGHNLAELETVVINKQEFQHKGSGPELSDTADNRNSPGISKHNTLLNNEKDMLTYAEDPVTNSQPIATFRGQRENFSPPDQTCRSSLLSYPSVSSSPYVSKITENVRENGSCLHKQSENEAGFRTREVNANENEMPAFRSNIDAPSQDNYENRESPTNLDRGGLSSINSNQNDMPLSNSARDNITSPTGFRDLEGSIDFMRKPSASKITKRSTCIRNISRNEDLDSEINPDDADESPKIIPNINDPENFPKRTSPGPTETAPKFNEVHDTSMYRFSCNLCNKYMNTRENYNAHMAGNTHRWNQAYSKAEEIYLGDVKKTLDLSVGNRPIYDRGYKATETIPRAYQLELLTKTMAQDSVVYLPTGTGKTLVSVLTMSLMLQDNFNRSIIFLVDKVLLVIQQGGYIEKELQVKSKKFTRFSLKDKSRQTKEERCLNLAFVCGGMTHSQGLPLWQHDIIITTADYCINLLEKGYIRWEHFSLAVLDEVHHCIKGHPYKKLLSYHTKIADPACKPKILGLTASPAGKDTVEKTYDMLNQLLHTLGGAKIAIPEGDIQKDELRRYQSDPKLRSFCVPLTSDEEEFQLECHKYFLQCYAQLAPMSSSLSNSKETPLLYLNALVKNFTEEAMDRIAKSLLQDSEPLQEVVALIFGSKCSLKETSKEYTMLFNPLRMHIMNFFFNFNSIATCLNFNEMEKIFEPREDNHELAAAKHFNLPCDNMRKHILRFKVKEKETNSPMMKKLFDILQDSQYIDWEVKDPMALVLVQERKEARAISNKLKKMDFVLEKDLQVTHLVGHGKGANDAGMGVKKQKRIIDKHKDFHILVATSIAEEGIDIGKLRLVISMNPPSTVRALVQMRGRARQKDSHFIILCGNEGEREKVDRLIKHEDNMLEAAKICMGAERG